MEFEWTGYEEYLESIERRIWASLSDDIAEHIITYDTEEMEA